jgi:hypothetical protein
MSRYEDFLNSQKTLGENSSNQAPTTRYEKFIQNQKLSSLVEYYNSLNNDIYNATKKLNTTGYIDSNTAKKDKNSISAKMTRAENIAKKIVSESEIYGIDSEKLKVFQDEHIKNIDSYNKILGFANDRANYYGQFKDEADYNTQKKNAGYYDKYKNYSATELAELISKTPEGSEEYNFLTELRGNKLYDEYSKFTDEQMAEIEAEYNKYRDANGRYQMLERKALNPHMSKITDAELRELEGMRARKREFESKYDYKLIEQVRAQDKAQKEYVLPYLEKPDFNNNSATIKIGKNNVDFKLGIAMLESAPAFIEYGDFSRNMQRATDEQKSVFAYIYNTQGQEAAKEWYEKLEPTLSYNASAKTQQEWKDFANKNWFNAVLTQIASIPANIVKGGVAVSDIMSNIAGVEIDPYDSAHTLVQFAPIVRQEVSKNWGPFGSYAYQLGMGMVDFGSQLLLSKGIGKAAGLSSAATSNMALGIMGTGAAADTITTAKLSGASDSQAIALGTMSGIIEVLCEKASIETLFGSSKGKLSYFLKNAFTEASEEGISSVANIITDMIIMSDKSEVETLAQKYLEGFTDSKGVYHKASTKAEALAMALTSKAPDVLLDALGGFISGGVLGGISLVGSSISANKAANNIINKNNTQGLIDLGLEMPKNSVAYDTAVSLKEQLEVTTADKAKKSVAKLYDSIRQEIGEVVSKYEGDKDAAAYTDYNRALNQYETLNNLVESADNIVAPNQEAAQNIAIDTENNAEISAENDLTANVETVVADIKNTIEDKNEGANEIVAKPSGEQTGTNGDMGVAQATKKAPKKNANKGIWTEGDMTPKQRDYMDNLVRKMGGVDTSLTEGQNYAKAVGKALGRNVYFVDMGIGDGRIDENTGDIYISKSNKNPLEFVLKHELTHFAERNTFKYQEFQNAIINSKVFDEWLKNKGYNSLAEYEAHIENLYKKAEDWRKKNAPKQDPIVLKEGGATKEAIANFVGEELFTEDGSTLQKLINGLNPSKKQSFLEVIRDFINWLKGKFTKSADKQMQLDIERFENMFNKIYAEAQQQFENGNTPTEEAGANNVYLIEKNSPKYDSEIATLKQQILNSQEQLNKLNHVANVNYEQLNFKSKYEAKKWVVGQLTKWGNQIDRQNFGRIYFSKSNIEYAIEHLDDMYQQTAVSLLPYVLKRGIKIGEHLDHKNRGKHTITFGAPIVINGTRGNMAVVVNMQGKHAYAAKVLLPDGSAFIFPNNIKETPQGMHQGVLNEESLADTTSEVSTTNIPYSEEKVNTQNSIPENKADTEYMSAVENGDMETAQRLVDEAAKKAGYTVKGYHGSRQAFNEFSKEKLGSNTNTEVSKRWFFAADEETANSYYPYGVMKELAKLNPKMYNPESLKNKGKLYSLYLKFENPLIVDVMDYDYDSHRENKDAWMEYVQQAEANGNDGIVLLNAMDNQLKTSARESTVYMFKESSQAKLADPVTYDDDGNVIPLSERFNENEEDIRYSVPDVQDGREAELQKLYRSGNITQEEYEQLINKRRGNTTPGEIIKTPKGEADTTPELARRTGRARGDGESKFYDSIQDSNILSDALKEEAKSNDFIKRYERIANKETMKDAAEALANGGRKYVNSWFAKKPTQFSAEDVCVGFILLDRYQKVKDYDSASAVAEKLREAGTVSGQTVQAFSILGRFTPEMMIAYAKKDLDSAYKTMIEGKSAEWVKRNKEKFKLTEDEQNFIRRKMVQASELPEGRDKNIRIAEINAMLQNKLPAEKGQAYKALQRISMLLNPKTNVRNVLGNALMVPIHLVDDFISTGVDTLVSKKTGFRTIGAPINVKENVKAFAQGAYESWDDFRRRISTRDVEMNRFDIGQGKSFREDYNFEARNKLGKALNALDRTTSFLLELGDRPFFQMWFINSLNNQMRINEVSEATAEMIEIATQEALERTWQDTNSFTKAVTGIKNGLNKITGEEFYNTFGYGLGDLFIKFTKTPANLTKAMVEFSPVGLVKALSLDAISFSKAVKTGQLTAAKQRKFVNNISKGITGTLLYVLFSALARAGITQGGGDEDKDVAAFEKNVLGIQPYSVKIGNSSFSYEWAQPIGAIMAITADIYQNGEGAKGEKQEWYNNILDAFKSGGKVLFNQSFMKGIQNFFEEDGFVTAMIDGALDEPAIFIPQFVSQTAGLFDDTSRTSFVYDDSLKSSLYGALAKIPGARNILPAQFDVFGRDVKNPYNDVFNAYINPANPRTDNSTPVSKELYEVYKQTGDKSVIPAVAPYYLTINDEKKVFTTEERQKYQQLTGGESAKQINNLLDDPAYKTLKADIKAEVIKDIYAYNTAQAKEELFGKELTSTQKKIEKYAEMGLDPEIYILVKTLQDGTSKASYEKAVDSVELDSYTKKLLLALNDAEGKKNEDALVKEAFKNYNK